jgi:hypothetical protein
VAEVVDWGSNTYTAMCVGRETRRAAAPTRAVGQEIEAVKRGERADRDLAADLLQRARDSLRPVSPGAIRRRWRRRWLRRHYIP